MSLPRKHNLEQMKKLRKITKGQDIGDIVKKGEKKKEDKMPNSFWMDNPFDRNIDTYESFVSNNKTKKIKESLSLDDDDAYIIWQNYLTQNEEFVNKNQMNIELIVDDIIDQNDYKDGIVYMKDELYHLIEDYFEMAFESVHNRGKGPGNNDFYNNNPKQKLNTQVTTNLLQIGKFVKVGNIEGYIDSVDNDFVYISSIKGDGKTEKISFKKFLKELKKEEVINEKSGLPSEFWDDYQLEPEPMEPNVETLEEDEELELAPEIQDESWEEEREVEDSKIRRIRPARPIRIKPNEPNKYPNDIPKKKKKYPITFGTEDNPTGRRDLNENIYVNDIKMVKCDDCGQMVEDTYRSKVAHVYNKHFNKPEMDGGVPDSIDMSSSSWPQGGKKIKELVNRYFPNN